jgi:hypothetical protein
MRQPAQRFVKLRWKLQHDLSRGHLCCIDVSTSDGSLVGRGQNTERSGGASIHRAIFENVVLVSEEQLSR